jgi:CBS domain-containing protein
MADARVDRGQAIDVEDEKVVGLVSIGDLVKFKSKQQSFEIKYLTDYITAR